jgi:hypothetical protein
MAKISAKNIELKDSERIIFGTDDDAFIEWDEAGNQLEVSTVVSGVMPTQPYHLTPRFYVDQVVSSGVGTFIALTDTPTTYSGYAGYVVAVTDAEDAVEFIQPGSFNVDGGFANSVYGGVPLIDGGGA